MTDALRKEMNELYVIFDVIEATSDIYRSDRMTLKERFMIDLFLYIMYLSVSDGKLAKEEISFMNEVFRASYDTKRYKEIIHQYGLGEESFEIRVPYFVKVILEYDDQMMDKEENYQSPLRLIQDFMYRLGKAFISCDGEVTEEEKENLKYYISHLGEYYDKNGDRNGGVEPPSPREGGASYKVPRDMTAGKYKLLAEKNKIAYYSIDAGLNCEIHIARENFFNQAYICVEDGEYIQLRRCRAVGIDEAERYVSKDGIFGSGEYMVGEEINPGEYRIIIQNKKRKGYCSVEEYDKDGKRVIIKNQSFAESGLVKVITGQILVLSNCYINMHDRLG